jgi:hypothetical protein
MPLWTQILIANENDPKGRGKVDGFRARRSKPSARRRLVQASDSAPAIDNREAIERITSGVRPFTY